MKKLIPVMVVFFVVFLCSNVHAVDLKGKFGISGTGGLGIPLGDFADKEKGAAKTGFGFGGNVEYFVTSNIVIGGNFTYYSFGMETTELEEFVEWIYFSETGEWVDVDIDMKQKITNFGVFVKYLFSTNSKAAPYLKLGLGSGKYKGSGDFTIEGLGSDIDASFDSKLAIAGGAGILYMASENIAITGEVLLNYLGTDDAKGTVTVMDESESDKLDYNTTYINVFVGLTFFFGGPRY